MACVCFFICRGLTPTRGRGNSGQAAEAGGCGRSWASSTAPVPPGCPSCPRACWARSPHRAVLSRGVVRSFSAVLYPPVQLLVWWERGGRWGPRATPGWWRVETESNAGVKTRRDGVGGDWRGAGGARGTRGRPPAGAAVCGRGRGEAYGGTAPPPAALFFPVAWTRGPTGCGWSVGSLSYEGGRGQACGAHL